MRRADILKAAVLLAAAGVNSLVVTSGSNCEALCTDGDGTGSSSTNTSEIVCKDNAFSNSGKGIKFRNCVSCLQDSESSSGSDSDVFAFLYNVRYAFDVCLFSHPGIPAGFTNTPCALPDSCGKLSDALETSLSPDGDDAYKYCDAADDFGDNKTWNNCIQCLQSTSDPSQSYYANFLVALKAGCETRPAKGSTVSMSGSLFTTDLPTIVNPDDDITNKPKGAGSSTLTTGALVGIAVGCSLLFAGAAVLLFIHCRKKRRTAREKLDSPPPDTPGAPEFIGAKGASSGGGLADDLSSKHKMSESISSYRARQDMSHKRAYSINTDTFNRHGGGDDDSQNHGLGLNYHYAPQSKGHGPFGALPAHPAYDPRVMSRASDRSESPPAKPGSRTKDSYALRTCLKAPDHNATSDAAKSHPQASHHTRSFSQPSPPRPAATKGVPPPPPPPGPPPKTKSKVPSLIMPSLSRAKASKTYAPPQVAPAVAQEGSSRRGSSISRPLAAVGLRFHDRPLGGHQVETSEVPASLEHFKGQATANSPMLTGDSRFMYG